MLLLAACRGSSARITPVDDDQYVDLEAALKEVEEEPKEKYYDPVRIQDFLRKESRDFHLPLEELRRPVSRMSTPETGSTKCAPRRPPPTRERQRRVDHRQRHFAGGHSLADRMSSCKLFSTDFGPAPPKPKKIDSLAAGLNTRLFRDPSQDQPHRDRPECDQPKRASRRRDKKHRSKRRSTTARLQTNGLQHLDTHQNMTNKKAPILPFEIT